jgi:hypothetical protein
MKNKPHQHRHRAATSGPASAYLGPVRRAVRQNRQAHGGVTYVETCACGAAKVVNRNGRHAEHGPWDMPFIHSQG